MKIRLGKTIGICVAVSMIILGVSFLYINNFNSQKGNGTYIAVRFAPVGYKWYGSTFYSIPEGDYVLARIRNTIDLESRTAEKKDNKAPPGDNSRLLPKSAFQAFDNFMSFEELQAYLKTKTKGKVIFVDTPTEEIKLVKDDFLLIWSNALDSEQAKVNKSKNKIKSNSQYPDIYEYDYLPSKNGIVRFKLFAALSTGGTRIDFSFTFYDNIDYPLKTAVEVE